MFLAAFVTEASVLSTQTRNAFLKLIPSKEQVAASTTEALQATYRLLDLEGGKGVLSPDIVNDFMLKADEIAKVLDASPNRKQKRRLLEDAVNLKYRVVRAASDADRKRVDVIIILESATQESYDATPQLCPVHIATDTITASTPIPFDKKPVIHCLKKSPILDLIHGEKVFVDADVIHIESLSTSVHSESTADSLRIGPLPEDWFFEPAALQIKFNGLVSSLPARTKGAETDLVNLKSIDVIAYDSEARSIYVEFPTLAYAMAFVDKWIEMAAMPPPGLESTACNIFD